MADQTDNDKSTLSDDWGEAFEAEDFMFAPEADTNSEFFLDDETIKGPESPGQKNSRDTTPGAQSSQEDKSQQTPSKLAEKLSIAKDRFKAASLPIKAAALTACLLLVIGIILTLPNPKESDLPDDQSVPVTDQEAEAKDASPGSIASQPTAPMTSAANPEPNLTPVPSTPASSPPEQIRKKWKLPSFMIATTSDNKQEQEKVLSIDLTLILLLKQGDHPPENQEIHARELIYQFFKNRPLTELERYSLARGEMIRNLRAWIEKQWPELPLESIAFNRYQIL